MPARPFVVVVDDDESVRESLPTLLHECGFDVEAFASAEAFLASKSLDRTNCLLLDVAMPGVSGPELYQELIHQGRNIPTIFITADSNETTRPRLLKLGAVECLLKPFSDTALLEAMAVALSDR